MFGQHALKVYISIAYVYVYKSLALVNKLKKLKF